MDKKQFFTKTLLKWDEAQNDRKMPWKGIKNPYHIWLSEIILQQTRVEQGLPYYKKFVEHYPTVEHLANAPEDEVMKLWEGLGYYSRARNLHFAAKSIVKERDGVFPDTYEEIIKLKGVGTYTAAAVASFAFDLPHAVVDGNVYRVLSRFFGIETAIDSTEGKKEFAKLAQELIDEEKAAKYNQAIMDFGAKHCTPAKPMCMFCSFQTVCSAFLEGKTDLLPKKSKKIKKKERIFYYLVIQTKKSLYLTKRIEKDIWQNLYDFPLIEVKKSINEQELREKIDKHLKHSYFSIKNISQEYQHILTHQKIQLVFVEIELKKIKKDDTLNWKKVSIKDLSNYAFPKPIRSYLEDNRLI